jgi:hypothetical protein
VVALVYCAGLQHEPSNLDAAASKAFNHDIFLPSWRAVMVTCFAELLWQCEKLCILGDTINLEVNRNGGWLMQKSKQHFMICLCCIVLHFWNGRHDLRLFVGLDIMSALRQIAVLYHVWWALL